MAIKTKTIIRATFTLSLGLISLTGCARLHSWQRDWVDHHHAAKAFKCSPCDAGAFTTHYRHGFILGYKDVATGGCGKQPVLPPAQYSTFKYRNLEGRHAIQTWFAGWDAGAAAAEADGAGHLNTMPIAPQHCERVGACRPASCVPQYCPQPIHGATEMDGQVPHAMTPAVPPVGPPHPQEANAEPVPAPNTDAAPAAAPAAEPMPPVPAEGDNGKAAYRSRGSSNMYLSEVQSSTPRFPWSPRPQATNASPNLVPVSYTGSN